MFGILIFTQGIHLH